MNRRTAIAGAASAVIVVVSIVVAVGANVGLLGWGDADAVGDLSSVADRDSQPAPAATQTIVVDVTDPPAPQRAAGIVTPEPVPAQTIFVDEGPAGPGPFENGDLDDDDDDDDDDDHEPDEDDGGDDDHDDDEDRDDEFDD